jgi:predicted phage-related endonuclease
MKIKVKNSDLNKDSIESINNLIDMDINVSSAFWLMKVVKEISPLIETKNELEKKITDKYAEKNESGEYVIPVDNNGDPIEGTIKIRDLEGYTKEISDLMNIENELSYDKMDINELGLKTIKTKSLFNLEFLFDM